MNQHQSLILIVDDTELNRELLKDMLKEEYRILCACNGREAMEILEVHAAEISILLLDVIMPEMDGFELLTLMDERHWIENLPVVMISAETSPDFIARGYELGAVDYISRPFDVNIIKRRLENTIILYNKQKMLKSIVTEQIREKERNNALMVNILSTIVEFRNGESGVHVLRIRVVTEILMEALMEKGYPSVHLTAAEIAVISNAASLHDVGKIVIPEEILNKPGKLTTEEFAVMETHTVRGAEMLESLHIGRSEELVRYAHDICRWHHERWDGGGYPDGLRGDQIPLWAQVVSLADVYDALTSQRVYKPSYSHEHAIQMILAGECGMFNPCLIQCLLDESDTLKNRITLQCENLDQLFDVDKISEEVMVQKTAALSDRTLYLLEQERIKNQFLATLSSDMFFDYDAQANTVTLSEQASAVLGADMLLQNARAQLFETTLISPDETKQMIAMIRKTTSENPIFRTQCLFCLPHQDPRWYELTARVLWSHDATPQVQGCIGKLVDVHSQKLESTRLMEQAQKDSLTNLYNHATARSRIEQSLLIEPNQPSVLFFLDVDNFKAANDNYGHPFGDGVLQHIASILTKSIRKSDVAARVGGDEFILFLENISDPAKIVEQADRIFHLLCASYEGYAFSISMGIAVYPQDGNNYETLLSHADQALYASKRAGKNRYAFYDQPDKSAAFQSLLSQMDSIARRDKG